MPSSLADRLAHKGGKKTQGGGALKVSLQVLARMCGRLNVLALRRDVGAIKQLEVGRFIFFLPLLLPVHNLLHSLC